MAIPQLPPELELSIFLLAYHNERRDAKHLVLVARRFYDWIIPHIFRIIVLGLGSGEFHMRFDEAIFQKYGHHVRYLWLGEKGLGPYLHLFPNVIDLVYWERDPADFPSLLQLPLQRLSIDSSAEVLPIIAKVTHLDISYASAKSGIPSDLYLPNLTHLCVNEMAPESQLRMFLDRERCPRLAVVIVWEYSSLEHNPERSQCQLVNDERLVAVQCHARLDWLRGARGEMDMWRFAEEILEKRRRDAT